jgi:beta-aspartyl-dipeptidase (metallo-type)
MDVGSSGALLETPARSPCARLSLEAVLPAFTTNPAKLLRLARKGTVAAGHDADLVVLDESHRADTVVVRGEIHVIDRTCIRPGTFE